MKMNLLFPVEYQSAQHDKKNYSKSNRKKVSCNFLWYITPGWMLIHSTLTIRNTITWHTPNIGICLDVKNITKWGLEKKISTQISKMKLPLQDLEILIPHIFLCRLKLFLSFRKQIFHRQIANANVILLPFGSPPAMLAIFSQSIFYNSCYKLYDLL